MQELLKKLLFGNAGGGNGGAPALSLSFTDGGTFDPRITFSRGTNATLTGSDGLIQYAPHNLLTNSEDFEAAAWVKSGGGVGVAPVVTANQAIAPDGSTTAELVVLANTGTTTSDFSWLYQNFSAAAATTYTYSVWVKASGPAEIGKVIVVSGAGGFTASVTLTADWQRVTQTSGTAGAGTISAGPRLRGTETTATTASFFLWGAQLNVGALQSYNSTTPKNLLGFTQEPENAAWTKSNSYVQQNLLTWSQDFDNAVWVKLNGTVVSNQAIAPDGTTTAELLYPTTTGTFRGFYQTFTASAVVYTTTVYAKAAGLSSLGLTDLAGSSAAARFDLISGTVGFTAAGYTASIQSVGNGWYRCSVTGTATAGLQYVYAYACDSASTNTATTSGTNGIFLWGAQLVQGSTAGDYTQTTSAAAPTRYVNWDGTLTGRKLVEDTTAGVEHRVFQSPTTPAATVAYGAYLKAGERTWGYLRVNDSGSVNRYAWFNLAAGTVGTVQSGLTASISSVGGGWYRCSVLVSAPAAVNPCLVGTAPSDAVSNYTGDGTSGIYVSDFQLANSASVDPYVYNPQAAAASAAFYGPRFDYDPITLAAKGLLIEEQRTNLVTYSEQFDNAYWSLTNCTITANATAAPSGTTSADKLVETTATGDHRVLNATAETVTSGATYTWSVFSKAGERTSVRFTNNSVQGATFDLSTGVASNVSGGITASSTNYGNGWYRLFISGTAATTAERIVVYLVSGGNTSYTGDGTSGAFIWGAQLEAGAFATSYIPTVASQVTRNADSASMLGDNFYTWYNPNQGTLYTEGGGANAAGSARLAGISDGTVSNRIINYLSGATQLAGLISSGGAAQANPTVNVASAASANKLAQGYLVNNVNIAANGTLGTLDTVANIPSVTLMRLGVDEVGTGAYLNGTIRRISYYSTRLSDASLQQITS